MVIARHAPPRRRGVNIRGVKITGWCSWSMACGCRTISTVVADQLHDEHLGSADDDFLHRVEIVRGPAIQPGSSDALGGGGNYRRVRMTLLRGEQRPLRLRPATALNDGLGGNCDRRSAWRRSLAILLAYAQAKGTKPAIG